MDPEYPGAGERNGASHLRRKAATAAEAAQRVRV